MENGPRQPNHTPVVVLAVIVGLLILAGAVAAALLLTRGGHSSSSAASATPAPAAVSAVGGTTVTVSAAPMPATVTTRTTTTGNVQTTSGNAPTVPGTDRQGFVTGDARCQGIDEAQALLSTSASQVAICSGPGGLYYRGYRTASGHGITLSAVSRSSAGYVVRGSDHATVYTVGPAGLLITTRDGVQHPEAALAYWSR
ncbi:hypothetical protein P0W64_11175 [Tsukamurella sp. 8F]|uniref:hypothetical protein n=1 Tax=unclassified Tsukamurella TaxID=2633480 RepID=UPI0023B8A909|nr:MULTISPECIES: hypothetical protein [unclassified Tsukamurella]MDF0528958.1 hypothetical protein [Tsukamurella sp. 8J]MDF0587331.1 hypothetical protein [Tsukamurella sp. 8F]